MPRSRISFFLAIAAFLCHAVFAVSPCVATLPALNDRSKHQPDFTHSARDSSLKPVEDLSTMDSVRSIQPHLPTHSSAAMQPLSSSSHLGRLPLTTSNSTASMVWQSRWRHLVSANTFDEETEARTMRLLTLALLQLSERGIRSSAATIRIIGDTSAGLLSSCLKGVGGLLNVLISGLHRLCGAADQDLFLNQSSNRSPLSLTSNRSERAKWRKMLQSVERVLQGVSHACVWTGELVESVSFGMGEAVQDSFKSLELVTKLGYGIVDSLLLPPSASDATSLNGSIVAVRNISVALVEALEAQLSSSSSSSTSASASEQGVLRGSLWMFTNMTEVKEQLQQQWRRWIQPLLNSSLPSTSASALPDEAEVSESDNAGASSDTRKSHVDERDSFAMLKAWVDGTWSGAQELLQGLRGVRIPSLRAARSGILSGYRRLMHLQESLRRPLQSMLDVPSIAPHLLAALAVVMVAGLLPYPTLKMKLWVMLTTIALCWVAVVVVEYTQRTRIAQRSSSMAIARFVSSQIQNQQSREPLFPMVDLNETCSLDDAHSTETIPTSSAPTTVRDGESAQLAWFNAAMVAVWSLLNEDLTDAGLGPYMSEVYERMLTTQLERIPPSVANLRLKRFDFGLNPPYLKGATARIERNQTCYREWMLSNGGRGAVSRLTSILVGDLDVDDEDLEDVCLGNRRGGGAAAETDSPYRSFLEKALAKLARVAAVVADSSDLSGSSASSSFSAAHSHSAHGTARRLPHRRYRSTTESGDMQQRFQVGCDQLVVDLDLLFASKDLGIILSLRPSESKSVVPEMAVTLKEMIFDGTVRLVIELTPDYPFFGNATMSFPRLPSLDFSVNSFGGLDLSVIPFAFNFINSSMYWLLDQYTEPRFTTLDLRHTICPRCDLQPAPSLPEVIVSSTQQIGRNIRNLLQNFRSKVDQTVKLVGDFWTHVQSRIRHMKQDRIRRERQKQRAKRRN